MYRGSTEAIILWNMYGITRKQFLASLEALYMLLTNRTKAELCVGRINYSCCVDCPGARAASQIFSIETTKWRVWSAVWECFYLLIACAEYPVQTLISSFWLSLSITTVDRVSRRADTQHNMSCSISCTENTRHAVPRAPVLKTPFPNPTMHSFATYGCWWLSIFLPCKYRSRSLSPSSSHSLPPYTFL